MSKSLGLASTLHDPQGVMTRLIAQTLPDLVKLYGVLVIAVTETTSAEIITLLDQHPNIVQIAGSRYVGASRLDAVRSGLADPDLTHIHYCDFDRLIHWWLFHRAELHETLTTIQTHDGYFALGRTQRAFDSHPVVQREPEYVTNRVFSWILGEQNEVFDVVAGSCAMGRFSAELLIQHSIEPTNATDCEWPMIVRQFSDRPITFLKTEGLEFETPTFHGDQVHQTSFNPQNWLNRVRLAKDSFEAAMRVRKQAGATR